MKQFWCTNYNVALLLPAYRLLSVSFCSSEIPCHRFIFDRVLLCGRRGWCVWLVLHQMWTLTSEALGTCQLAELNQRPLLWIASKQTPPMSFSILHNWNLLNWNNTHCKHIMFHKKWKGFITLNPEMKRKRLY